MNDDEKYLGNPIVRKKNKNNNSQSLISKVKCRIRSCLAHLLSQAGSTLIKSVASTIPIYNMLVLQLPSKAINTMDKKFRKFFWGGLP